MQSRDQGKISSIKNLDPGRGWFYSPYESDHPLSMAASAQRGRTGEGERLYYMLAVVSDWSQ